MRISFEESSEAHSTRTLNAVALASVKKSSKEEGRSDDLITECLVDSDRPRYVIVVQHVVSIPAAVGTIEGEQVADTLWHILVD